MAMLLLFILLTAQTMLSNSVPELDILAMEKEIKKWYVLSIWLFFSVKNTKIILKRLKI